MDEKLFHHILVAQREIQNAGGYGRIEITIHNNTIKIVRVIKNVDIIIAERDELTKTPTGV